MSNILEGINQLIEEAIEKRSKDIESRVTKLLETWTTEVSGYVEERLSKQKEETDSDNEDQIEERDGADSGDVNAVEAQEEERTGNGGIGKGDGDGSGKSIVGERGDESTPIQHNQEPEPNNDGSGGEGVSSGRSAVSDIPSVGGSGPDSGDSDSIDNTQSDNVQSDNVQSGVEPDKPVKEVVSENKVETTNKEYEELKKEIETLKKALSLYRGNDKNPDLGASTFSVPETKYGLGSLLAKKQGLIP